MLSDKIFSKVINMAKLMCFRILTSFPFQLEHKAKGSYPKLNLHILNSFNIVLEDLKILNLQLNSYLISRLHVMKNLPIFFLALFNSPPRAGHSQCHWSLREGSQFSNIWIALFHLSEILSTNPECKAGLNQKNTHRKLQNSCCWLLLWNQAQNARTECLCLTCCEEYATVIALSRLHSVQM